MRAGCGAAEARLEEVRRQLDRWRRGRRGSAGRIPNELWRAAAEVAAVCGVERTAARLEVNGERLQQWVERCEPRPVQPEPTAFVELPPLPFGAASECTLELEDSTGRRLRISLKGQATAQVVPLSQLLWRSEP
jgi:hypothetical protein